ncbi:LysR family transcriptional regulator [Bacillus massiliigorillae]|uniref:LysR family transcriptional regulator n=1 Tax=Bacillus massiliigorillae TaxID=1243664 RepID=UPI00039B2B15|nr:LysR family transcriptional regulator [Bacillus massiliigorillae]
MNLRQLYYFKTLAKLEHYTQAASHLSITQPSLSHAISELEKELGIYLFEKHGRNVRLTKYGRYFLTYVENALEELEKGERKMKKLASPTEGVIDLAFIYTLGSRFIPNIIQAFSNIEQYKNISFSFSQGITKNIIQGLKDEKYDLAFCSMVDNEPDIEFTPIAQQELVLIVPENHPLADYDSVNLKDTAPYPFVFFNPDSGIRPIINNLFEQVNVKPKIVCEVEEDSAIAGLVSVNYGIAVMPRIVSLEHHNVKILEIEEPAYHRYIYLASVKNHYLSPAVCHFRDFVISYAKEQYSHSKSLI